MGADLYLTSEYEPNRTKWARKFNQWVEIRDALTRAGKREAADKAQKTVARSFNKLLSKGYFRDSYNNSSLLWLFGLSWWEDIGSLLDKDNKLTPDHAAKLMQMLSERKAIFQANLKKQNGEQEYFLKKYERFQGFLKEAIARNESIVCSI